jgi:hypothetical protein
LFVSYYSSYYFTEVFQESLPVVRRTQWWADVRLVFNQTIFVLGLLLSSKKGEDPQNRQCNWVFPEKD